MLTEVLCYRIYVDAESHIWEFPGVSMPSLSDAKLDLPINHRSIEKCWNVSIVVITNYQVVPTSCSEQRILGR